MSIWTNKTSRRKEESAVPQYHELRAIVFCDSCPSGYACILALKIAHSRTKVLRYGPFSYVVLPAPAGIEVALKIAHSRTKVLRYGPFSYVVLPAPAGIEVALKIFACRGAPAHSHPDLPCAQAFMVVPVTCNAICPLWMTDDPFVLSIFKDNERVYARQERG
jgi:hypothetical protein